MVGIQFQRPFEGPLALLYMSKSAQRFTLCRVRFGKFWSKGDGLGRRGQNHIVWDELAKPARQAGRRHRHSCIGTREVRIELDRPREHLTGETKEPFGRI